ncbi:MAG: hypothetical protein KJ709_01705 [Nanoarchaeota archaeon]|nr:hypothetical protein [Nanoarchaeota archaeon]
MHESTISLLKYVGVSEASIKKIGKKTDEKDLDMIMAEVFPPKNYGNHGCTFYVEDTHPDPEVCKAARIKRWGGYDHIRKQLRQHFPYVRFDRP